MYGLFSEYRSVWDMFYYFFLLFSTKLLQIQNNVVSLHRNWEIKYAQMAESVDALVSNTSGFTSIPVRPRVWVQVNLHRWLNIKPLWRFFLFLLKHYWNFSCKTLRLRFLIELCRKLLKFKNTQVILFW